MIPTVASASRTATEPIPGYKLVKRIGAGGYGEVWSCEAPGGLLKAIKFVYGLLDEDRAAREMKALSRIKVVRHPFLLSLEQIVVVDGQLLIVTELADCSLKDRFEECRKANQTGISRDELLGYLRDAADALDYMSEKHSLQHLDVKPENLLLMGQRVKVADFGLVKDIHEHTASMMGGLTPVYAPPEVFEGRPTRRSDQYSLAIVYQEMLTAVLPFPGRTAAQLAAQHLNAKPRLSSLSENEQQIIGRALSKSPEERFGSCTELITALTNSLRQAAAPVAGGWTAPASDAAGQATSPRNPSEMLANLDAATRAVNQLSSTGGDVQPTQAPYAQTSPAQAGQFGQYSGGAPVAELSAHTAGLPGLASFEAAPPLVDVPGEALDPRAGSLRPTLFIGLGGSGGNVLRRLRQRLNDRVPPELRNLVPLLLVDTDAREIANAAHGEGGRLSPEETLVTPLRRSQDYRDDSRKLLEWLSRRWLYNIPRSLQTEGLRPLGRLAFVDHAEAIKARLQRALTQLSEDAAAVDLRPRVVIVASPSGGSGSGMVADVAFLTRQLADELPQGSGIEILAVLSHGTNRNLQQQDLASANTVATLSELAQYHRPGALFPGDPACGLKPRKTGALNGLYLVHVGEELGPFEIEEASERIAEFLMLDAVTAVGNVLATARAEQGEEAALSLRSFNLSEFGFAHDRLLDDSVTGICRAVLRKLKGPEASAGQPKQVRLLGGGGVTESTANPFAALDLRAAGFIATLGLAVEPLMQLVEKYAAEELGGDPEAFFRKLMVAGPAHQPPVEKWVSAACDLFGRQHSDTSIQAQPGELAQALDQRLGGWIAEVGARIRAGVDEVVEDQTCRVTGAQRVAKLIQAHLKGLADKLGEARNCFARECQPVIAALAGLDNPAKAKAAKRSPQDIATLFMQYCRLRLIELAALRAGKIAHALQSHAVAAHDSLVDVQRDLDHLASRFAAAGQAALPAEINNGADDNAAKLRAAVVQQLSAAEEPLAEKIAVKLNESLFTKRGGLRALLAAGGDALDQLVESLKAAAREAALVKVQEVDLAAILFAGEDREGPLASALAAAQPWLARCGGRRRLIVVVPPQLAAPQRVAMISAQISSTAFGQQPSVVPGSSSDYVLLFELGNVSLAHAAAHLISFRRDLAEAAARLYTRCDVHWTPPFAC